MSSLTVGVKYVVLMWSVCLSRVLLCWSYSVVLILPLIQRNIHMYGVCLSLCSDLLLFFTDKEFIIWTVVNVTVWMIKEMITEHIYLYRDYITTVSFHSFIRFKLEKWDLIDVMISSVVYTEVLCMSWCVSDCDGVVCRAVSHEIWPLLKWFSWH